MKKILLLVLLSTVNFLIAQKQEFLKIPSFNEADLSKTQSSIDPEAPAEYLHRSAHIYLNHNTGFLEMKFFGRLKIYDKDKAENWLNIEVPLWDINGKRETLDKMKAVTYNLENGKAVTTKVDRSSKYKSKENDKVNVEKFAFPNVKNGSIIEYDYTIGSPYFSLVPPILIEQSIPSQYTEYVLEYPLNVSYNLNYTGELTPKYSMNKDMPLYGSEYRTIRMGFENIKGFKSEKFTKNDNNFKTKISAELNSTNFGGLKKYALTWNDIKERLMKEDEFGGELKKTKLVRELLPASLKNTESKLEKANIIFDYVKSTYTWNGILSIWTKDGIKKLLETKVGNSSEINLLLVMMFREAGLEADPMVISTVQNGVLNHTSPNINQLNNVIAVTYFDNMKLLYDATSKQSSVNNLPPRDWNEFGVLLANKPDVLQLVNVNESINNLTINAKLTDNGSISGTYSDRDTGAYAMYAKSAYDENPDKYKKQYKDDYSLDFTNINSKVNADDSFESTMSFNTENGVDKIGKKMIFNPLFFMYKNNNEFDQKTERRFPISFLSPYTKEKKVTIEIPEGYVVSELPKSKKIVTEDREIQYSYVAEQKQNKVTITSLVKVGSSTYPKEYYPAFKQIWDNILKSENQLISIEKK